jgi:hypothetical protein
MPINGPNFSAPGDVEKAAVAVVLGLEEPGRIVEGVAPGHQKDGLDVREGFGGSWAHEGFLGSLVACRALPTRRCLAVPGASAYLHSFGERVRKAVSRPTVHL